MASDPTATTPGWGARAAAYFALDPADDDWVRRAPAGAARADLVLALAFVALASLGLELARSGGALERHAVWGEYLVILSMTAPIVVRRRLPVLSAVAASLAFLVGGVTMPDVALQLSVQAVYFFALFSAMAWASSRRAVLAAMGAILVLMFGWLTVQYSVGSAVDQIRAQLGGATSTGFLGPIAATIIYSFLVNVFYFGGAVVGGQAAWRAARSRARLADQAARLSAQAGQIREHAVVQERLHIARELHDVVAHHVSVMGVQAAAARRVMERDPATAAAALSSVEESARSAVSSMRSLVGTLRAVPGDAAVAVTTGSSAEQRDRTPVPGVRDLATLAEEARQGGIDVDFTLVESAPGALDRVGPAAGLALYRTAQEAVSNVRRHSTAAAARVTLRVDAAAAGFAEVEVLDDGRPRSGTSGSGLGLLGMRERVGSLGGTIEVGPRVTGGYRVRVRLPLAPRTDAS